MKTHTAEEIIEACLEDGRAIAGFPSTFTAKDFALAGEDHVNDRTLVTLVDWARMTMLGASLVPHVPSLDIDGRVKTDVGVGCAPVALSLSELRLIRDAISQHLSAERRKLKENVESSAPTIVNRVYVHRECSREDRPMHLQIHDTPLLPERGSTPLMSIMLSTGFGFLDHPLGDLCFRRGLAWGWSREAYRYEPIDGSPNAEVSFYPSHQGRT